ncbi:hypothetical protein HGRIS_014108 [Hohenbuehelia grisea]|uniref:Glycosyl transferase CAP10 domain-containing protein n=1 Tax=Hohenbuehelia grisea TaxID=104357 RepID=A0ABR3JUJ9_9AGAR
MLVSGRLLKLVVVPVCIFAFFFAAHIKELLIFLLIGRDDYQSAPNPLLTLPTCIPGPGMVEQERILDPVPFKVAAPAQKPLEHHNFRDDGLLVVNPNAAHPIYDLISRAEARWNDKLKRASKTLGEAVMEYKRRYKRDPPRGFDDWWEYVTQNNVQLPDEYDQIYQDLEPFWGIEPEDLLKVQQELETKRDSYTLGKNATGPVEVVTYAFDEGRYNQLIKGSERILDLLEDIEAVLPPFRMTFSPHDGPNRLTDHGVKEATLQAAREKKYVRVKDLPKTNSIGWRSACSPSSPARQMKIDLDKPPPPPNVKSFIYDHALAMDPCIHPELLFQHGQFLSHNMGPGPQTTMIPEFSQCSTTVHHNIRIPTPYGWIDDLKPEDDPPFAEKIDERLLWRGSNTGIFHATKTRWRAAHRGRLVTLTNELNGTVQVLNPITGPKEPVGKPRHVRKARLNPALMDVAYAGEPIACSANICPQLRGLYEFRKHQTIREAGNYKYVIDVDGNGWSGRFKRLITSNALVFKATIYPEWFADRIQPWVHYVPVQVDLSDLHDSLLFFRGEFDGTGAHEDLAAKMADAGRKWSKTFWRREDLVAYFYRLILEFTRLMSTEREKMVFRIEEHEGE